MHEKDLSPHQIAERVVCLYLVSSNRNYELPLEPVLTMDSRKTVIRWIFLNAQQDHIYGVTRAGDIWELIYDKWKQLCFFEDLCAQYSLKMRSLTVQ